MATVTIDRLNKTFATPTGPQVVLDDVSFTVADSSFVSLVGPSGCGKTTLLNIVSGVEPQTSGSVHMEEHGQPARLAYVFQEPRLLPWRTVVDNLLYVQPRGDRTARDRVMENLELVGLANAAKKYPGQLSGGQQQRIGIARAFSVSPDVLLMDEPFSHLDAITARSLRAHLQDLWLHSRKTVLFVTHDVTEAVELSDRIIMLANGDVQQDITVELPRPRRGSDQKVALMEARILGQFEELEEQQRPPSQQLTTT